MTTTPEDHHPEEEDQDPDSPSDAKPDARRDEFNVWDAIVADLTGQLDTGDLDTGDLDTGDLDTGDLNTGDPIPPKSDPMIDELLSEGSFEPPEPPPLRVPADMITRLGWGGVLGGPVIVFASSVIGIGSTGVGIGLLAFASGFAVLIIKMKDRDPQDDDGDGAVV